MEPQNTQQPSDFTHPYVPMPEQRPPEPQKSPKNILLIIVAVVIGGMLIGGIIIWLLQMTKQGEPTKEPPTRLNSQLNVGDRPYLTACNIMTADDLDETTGLQSNRAQVTATFAEQTYKSERAYLTSCSRYDQPDPTKARQVIIYLFQYPNGTARNAAAFAFGLSDGLGDEAVSKELGVPAVFDRGSLRVLLDTGVVSVTTSGYDNASAQTVAITTAKKLITRASEQLKSAPSALKFTSEALKIGTYTYRNACDLWKSADSKEILGSVDQGYIETAFAERISDPETLQGLFSHCRLRALDEPKYFTDLRLEQYRNAPEASATFNSRHGFKQSVIGFGDRAVYDKTGDSRHLIILLNNTILNIELRQSSSLSSEILREEQFLKTLQGMATTILARLR